MSKTVKRFEQKISTPGIEFERGGHDAENGLGTKYTATAIFDPSANTGERTVAAHGLGVYIPDNAIITKAWYDVITTFQSATDAATLALHTQTANDLVSAIAISDASNVWDSGLHGTLTAGTTTLTEAAPNTRTQIVHATDIVAGFIKLTAEREITATIAVEAVTAGKCIVFVEYILSA